MSSATTPAGAFPDQFEELSRAMFLRFHLAAKLRQAAGPSQQISMLRYGDTLPKLASPAPQMSRCQTLHAH